MIKGITKNEHVYADYSYVAAALLAPKLMKFKNDKIAANVSRGFALSSLAISLLTDAKWGCWKIIPYKVHAILDISTGALALAAAATAPICKDRNARNTFIVMGVTGLIVGALSVVGANNSKTLASPFS
jgi:hypothetical protein